MTILALALVAVVVVVLAACVVTFVVAVTVLTRRKAEPPTRTVLSPDGNYWWDGLQWQPVPRS